MPTVSVIVPNYNHSKYLAQRIDSILNQSYQDFELIILDDKSPDDSKTVIEQYRNHPKVSQIVYNEVNSGSTFRQWNRGVALATGDWIWLAESDDYADALFLDKLITKAKENPSVGLLFANSYFVDELCKNIHNPYVDISVQQDVKFTSDFIAEGIPFCTDFILNPIIVNASSALFKRSLFNQIGGADEDYKLCGDWKMWHEMLLHTDLGYCADKLNCFRQHTNNVRSTKGVKLFLYELTKMVPIFVEKLKLNSIQKEHVYEKLFREWVFGVIKNGSQIPLINRYKITKVLLKEDYKFLFRVLKWFPEKIGTQIFKLKKQ